MSKDQEEKVTPLREPTAIEYQLSVSHWQNRATQFESENRALQGKVEALKLELKRKATTMTELYEKLLDAQEKLIVRQRKLSAVLDAITPD